MIIKLHVNTQYLSQYGRIIIYNLYITIVIYKLILFCRWHGCPHCKLLNRDDTKYGKSLNWKFEQTQKTSKYIQECGFALIEMWECRWNNFKMRNPNIVNTYAYPTEWKYRMNEREILSYIDDDSIFGAVEVDLHVPEHLKPYFEEMPPIFKNDFVKFEDIGAHMQNYLKESGENFNGRKYLIGSMFANNILLITPLLKWYINKGLVVTRVHQVIEFKPVRCFQTFVEQITNDRRNGDSDHTQQAVAETSKLTGKICLFSLTTTCLAIPS